MLLCKIHVSWTQLWQAFSQKIAVGWTYHFPEELLGHPPGVVGRPGEQLTPLVVAEQPLGAPGARTVPAGPALLL